MGASSPKLTKRTTSRTRCRPKCIIITPPPDRRYVYTTIPIEIIRSRQSSASRAAGSRPGQSLRCSSAAGCDGSGGKDRLRDSVGECREDARIHTGNGNSEHGGPHGHVTIPAHGVGIRTYGCPIRSLNKSPRPTAKIHIYPDAAVLLITGFGSPPDADPPREPPGAPS